jgi:hypothetical protein
MLVFYRLMVKQAAFLCNQQLLLCLLAQQQTIILLQEADYQLLAKTIQRFTYIVE